MNQFNRAFASSKEKKKQPRLEKPSTATAISQSPKLKQRFALIEMNSALYSEENSFIRVHP